MTEFTIEQYDIEVLRHKQAEDKRRHERSLERIRHASYSVGWLAAAGTILGIIWMIWQGTAGVSADDREDNKARLACIDAGGSWVKVGGTERSGGYSTCFGAPIKETK